MPLRRRFAFIHLFSFSVHIPSIANLKLIRIPPRSHFHTTETEIDDCARPVPQDLGRVCRRVREQGRRAGYARRRRRLGPWRGAPDCELAPAAGRAALGHWGWGWG